MATSSPSYVAAAVFLFMYFVYLLRTYTIHIEINFQIRERNEVNWLQCKPVKPPKNKTNCIIHNKSSNVCTHTERNENIHALTHTERERQVLVGLVLYKTLCLRLLRIQYDLCMLLRRVYECMCIYYKSGSCVKRVDAQRGGTSTAYNVYVCVCLCV